MLKTVKNVYDKAVSFNNLLAAHKKSKMLVREKISTKRKNYYGFEIYR